MENQNPKKKIFQRDHSEIPPQVSSLNNNFTPRRTLIEILRSLKKSNWKDFELILAEHNIKSLYHFTDLHNIPSIKQNGGLFSYLYCNRNNIGITKPGGNEASRSLDERKQLHNHVHVSFVKLHPMIYIAQKDGRITHPAILEIDPKLIFLSNTKFTTQNAVKNGVFADGSLDTFKKIQFNLFKRKYLDLTEDEKSYFQAEVLVLQHIPSESILNLNLF
jgi:hypothetical protein